MKCEKEEKKTNMKTTIGWSSDESTGRRKIAICKQDKKNKMQQCKHEKLE